MKRLLESNNSPPLNAKSYIVVTLLCRWYALWLVKNKNSRHFANIRNLTKTTKNQMWGHGGMKSMRAIDGGYLNSIRFPTGQLDCLWLLWLVPLFHVFFSRFVHLFHVWLYYTMPRELCGSRWLPHYNTKQPIELYRNIHAYMFFNHHVDAGLKTREDEVVEPVENFKYLGSWISDPGHDFKSFNLDSSQQNGKNCGAQSWYKHRRSNCF